LDAPNHLLIEMKVSILSMMNDSSIITRFQKFSGKDFYGVSALNA